MSGFTSWIKFSGIAGQTTPCSTREIPYLTGRVLPSCSPLLLPSPRVLGRPWRWADVAQTPAWHQSAELSFVSTGLVLSKRKKWCWNLSWKEDGLLGRKAQINEEEKWRNGWTNVYTGRDCKFHQLPCEFRLVKLKCPHETKLCFESKILFWGSAYTQKKNTASELLVCELAHTTRDKITRFWLRAPDTKQWLLVKTFPSKANIFRRKNMTKVITVTFWSLLGPT